ITFTKKGLGTYITENKNTINQLKKELAQTAMNTFIENMHKIGFNNQELITALNNHLNKEGS
ncbi:GntR family transcriptional regulator, partial [Peptococcaceae bacterium]|nr:GntR family transcriptional regulator [Peptococcaceae bacterium]